MKLEFKRNKKKMALIFACFCAAPGLRAQAGTVIVEPNQLIRDAMKAQVFSETGLVCNLDMASVENGKETMSRYEVQSKSDNTLVTTVEPAVKRGQVFLRLKDSVWFYKPGMKKPIGVSASQKMEGQSSNADVAGIDYERDYATSVEGEENYNGIKVWKLKLKAKGLGGAYDVIKALVSKDQHLLLRADYFAVSGELLKTATLEYNNKANEGSDGRPIVSSMKIVSALNPADFTMLTYSNLRQKQLSDEIFHRDSLVK